MIIKNKNITNAQHGFATILIVLLVGLSIGISALGTAYYINMSQKSLVSSHALTNAQSGAWTGVEIFRKYLEVMDTTGISSLNGQSLSLNIQDGRTLQVKNISSEEVGTDSSQFRVTANIQNISEQAKSSSTVQAVYLIDMVSNNSNPTNNTSINAIDIYGDLNVSGGIEIKGGKDAILNIHGNLTSSSNTFTGVSELNVTGDVTLKGGGEEITKIVSNGNVTIGSSKVDSIYAQGTVTLNGGGTVGAIYSNKDVTIPNGNVTLIDTLGNITISSGKSVPTAIAGGYINVKNGSIGTANAKTYINLTGGGEITTAVAGTYIAVDNGSVGTAHAQGNITFKGKSATSLTSGKNITISNGEIGTANALGIISVNGGEIINALAKGNISLASGVWSKISNITTEQIFNCNTQWWSGFISIKAAKINGVNNCPSSNLGVNTSFAPVVTFTINEPIIPTGSTKIVTTSTIKVDANEYLSETNYIFDVDTVGNIIVSVKNIRGITNGTYYLGRKVLKQSKTYLCANINNEVCTINPVGRIGGDQNWDYKPITYNSRTGWSLVDNKSLTPSIAPGILFFYGDVDIGQGTYINTFLATGNITVSIPKVYAPNYADVDLVCNTSYGIPTNVCTSSMVLSKTNIGYIALLAGSYSGTEYVGGDITTTSNAYIYGNIIAGNKFNTNGATSVTGQIVAANLGSSSTTSSSFNSKVTVDLTNIDKTIDDSGDDSGGEKNDSSTTRNTTIKWARYL